MAGFYLLLPSWKETSNGILTEVETGVLDARTIVGGVLGYPCWSPLWQKREHGQVFEKLWTPPVTVALTGLGGDPSIKVCSLGYSGV